MRTLLHALLAAGVLLAGTSVAQASANLMVASTAATIGTTAASQLIRTPSGGLGVYASRWDSKDSGVLTGYGIRLGWTVVSQLGLEGRAGYYEAEEDSLSTTVVPIEVAVTWRVPIGKNFTPYIGAGIGYYMKDFEYDDTTTWDGSDKSAGYFALAGASLRTGPVSLFADAKYTLVGTSDDLEWRGSDVDAKHALDGLVLTAGLCLGF